jgi:hypothetical protein
MNAKRKGTRRPPRRLQIWVSERLRIPQNRRPQRVMRKRICEAAAAERHASRGRSRIWSSRIARRVHRQASTSKR